MRSRAGFLLLMLGLALPWPDAAKAEPAPVGAARLTERIEGRLAARGYDPGPVDGKVDARSRAAIKALQRDLGNPQTGDLSKAEIGALFGDAPLPRVAAPVATPSAPPAPAPAPAPAPPPAMAPAAPAPSVSPRSPEAEAQARDEALARTRGAGQGELEIFLAWGTRGDIDLHVVCPTGERIHALSLSACGGRLDLDTNGSGNPTVPDPVEHIVFPEALPGRYRVEVGNCRQGGPPEPFRAWVVYRGRTIAERGDVVPVDPAFVAGRGCGRPLSYLNFSIAD